MTDNNLQDQLKVEGINSMGYGIMPKSIMKDDRLTIEAKAIYAYFVSFAGAGNTAFPKLKTILADLCISEKRFYKHRQLLIDCGYISVEAHRNEKAVIYKNVYTLHTNPEAKNGVSVKTTDRVSVNLTDGGTRQNDCDKLLLTDIKINNKKDDDDILSARAKTSEDDTERQIAIIKQACQKPELKHLGRELMASGIKGNDMTAILEYFLNKPLDPECVQQQLDWMAMKTGEGVGISSFSKYFIYGYEDRLCNKGVNLPSDLSDALKRELGIDTTLPEIPMYNWLTGQPA